MEGLSTSLYSEDIVAFTPKGKGIILPKGATAIDFAYEIHSHVGEHAQYARINGDLRSIRTELRRGDCVEIGVDPEVVPQKSWLDSAVTFKAKRRIAAYLKKLQPLAFDRCPLCKPLPGDEIIGFKNGDGRITIHSRHCADAIRRASEDGDSIVSVNFEENSRLLYPVKVHMVAIDRFHLLRDVIDCITELHNLSIDSLETASVDNIVSTDIVFSVHSAQELDSVIAHLSAIRGADEVQVC